MADPKGFITTPRETPVRRPVDLRLLDWREVYEPFPAAGWNGRPGGAWTAASRSATTAARWGT